MVTCTYSSDQDGHAAWRPNHMSEFIRHIRQYLKRRGHEFRYTWVMEHGKKTGRVHYHLLIWLPRGQTLPKPDKRGWWKHGYTKIEWVKHAVGYIAKYATKADGLVKPEDGARMHGNGGLTDNALLEARWWKLPAWVREIVKIEDKAKRKEGGGILVQETGEILISPWEVSYRNGKVYIKKKEASPCS